VTTLPNKIRVATEEAPGHFHSVGVYVDAGSRFESPQTSGVSHIIDRLAFKVGGGRDYTETQSTENYSDDEMTTLIDSLGSQISCSSSRETIMYQSTTFPQALPTAMSLLASTILKPLLLPEELVAQKEAAAYEIREIWAKPELILPEIVHHVAYKDNTLGMPLLCPEERLQHITADTVRGFMKDWYKPERIVVAGVGMEHEQLVDLTAQHFGHLSAGSSVSSSSTSSTSHLHQTSKAPSLSKSFATVSGAPVRSHHSDYESLRSARAIYTGGQKMISKPEEEFTHLYVGFEGLGIHDPDIVSRQSTSLTHSMHWRRFRCFSEVVAAFQPEGPVKACTRDCTPTCSIATTLSITALGSTTVMWTRVCSVSKLQCTHTSPALSPMSFLNN
jgi:processing peptidase subunit alpha